MALIGYAQASTDDQLTEDQKCILVCTRPRHSSPHFATATAGAKTPAEVVNSTWVCPTA